MAYSYYQQAIPGWGTNQFRFIPPPAPSFQPQPYWGGSDFYRAHAASPDLSLYNHAMTRIRDFPDGPVGVGFHEARHWHRRAYGGLGEINLLSAAELGHAAAYEAYRTWIHHTAVQAPLSGDIERQREALIALAIAEVTRLLQYSGRPQDPYLRSAASEAAAHTASHIFYQTRDGLDNEFRSRSRPLYREDVYDDPYYDDDELAYPRQYRSRSRHRSRSRRPSYSGAPGAMQVPSISYSTNGGLPGGVPGVVRSDYTQPGYGTNYGSPYPGSTMPVAIPGRAESYPGGMAMGNAASFPGTSMSSISPSGYQIPLGGTPSYNPSIAAPSIAHSRSRSTSFSYPQQAYPQQAYMGQPMSTMSTSYMGMPSTAPGQTIIIQPRKHRSKHRHRHRRSRSSDRY